MSDTTVKISAILSTYTEPLRYVEEAVSSITNQTLQADEICVVIDDITNIPVVTYLNHLAKTDNRFIVIKNATPQGLATCRNQGIQNTTGSFIALMDADDISVPNRFETQMNWMKQYDCELLFTHMEYIDENSKSLETYFTPIYKPERALDDILTQPLFAHPTAFIRRTLFEKIVYDPAFKKGQDTDLWLRCLMAGYTFCILPERLFLCRLHRQHSSYDDRIARQRGYATYGMKIIKKHYSKLWKRPRFWLYASKRFVYYPLLMWTPRFVVIGLMKLRDFVRGA